MFIEIRNLTFKYRNSQQKTLKDVSFNVQKGEILSILGESGGGKSTILRLIAGLETPLSGSIIVDNKIMFDSNTLVIPEKRGVGMVFQDYALFPHMKVDDNIKFGLTNLNKKEKDVRVLEMLKLVNLQDFSSRYPHELSGGQQQRVAIARALAPKPSVLLLDEPFSNLDTDLKSKIREELKSILNQAGITSIFVTHDREDVKSIADKVVTLKEGEILKSGKLEEVL
ncbi:putrescine transport ATP-binding protein PotG [Clostridium pasteurianum DSM 525 = ATCC 6013]|uniref:ABC-type quaternary amine transporter n=1 Tax=Clostridium pasteurianum DSM 525 = ATCC 6013 TaxID=1262449 RepID=A0A0H3J505_CLOPA|nr:ABC transporter ATP-binding protein [Clostridium pasteurianum]AJA48594.1 putrescine transport ATP-binding protein PotG [Clostridium pasteurianum DSM 525 = ATCC 6013]AJA52582.1 putrescine transport ATP-binding protein PotG [Clostridium pasteurianum DSM 525 = ATCC 6013]AOZ75825.1 ABC transporter [Clostridium pasteurianum DSM 525 = ATCC 6013]AOZ79621.1 ABC transporter [Clostridium pasteurianum]ELP57928.1 iron(III) ABC transporter ATP-binding protein [Clostridium pasteurianum DSM 525 = ATCC 601